MPTQEKHVSLRDRNTNNVTRVSRRVAKSLIATGTYVYTTKGKYKSLLKTAAKYSFQKERADISSTNAKKRAESRKLAEEQAKTKS